MKLSIEKGKSNKEIVIDRKVWTMPQIYANELGVTVQTVVNWMNRGKIEVWHIEELDTKLVKRGSETVKKRKP